jgi:hypothetical protein
MVRVRYHLQESSSSVAFRRCKSGADLARSVSVFIYLLDCMERRKAFHDPAQQSWVAFRSLGKLCETHSLFGVAELLEDVQVDPNLDQKIIS